MVLSHVFRRGHLAGPLVAHIGDESVLTQTDIKARWPDGSVKHAIISFLIPELGAYEPLKIGLHASNESNTYEKADLSALRGSGSDNFDAAFDFTGSADNVYLSDFLDEEDEVAGRVKPGLREASLTKLALRIFLIRQKSSQSVHILGALKATQA